MLWVKRQPTGDKPCGRWVGRVSGSDSGGSNTGLVATDLDKRFGGVHALKGVDFSVGGGEVVGLLGENGAGKSTLIRVLAGLVRPDSGAMRLGGHSFGPHGAREALRKGVVLVPQELDLAKSTNVLDNVWLGWERARFGVLIDKVAQERKVQLLRDTYGLPIPDSGRLVNSLGLGDQQIVAIARALIREPAVLLLDEPTSALSAEVVEVIFRAVKQLARSGVGVVFVSHRMDELRSMCDRIVVMRDGRVVREADGSAEPAELVRAMVGSSSAATVRQRESASAVLGEVVYSAQNLRLVPGGPSVSLEIRRGEIVGLSGLNGQGQSELLRVLAGDHFRGGRRILRGEDVTSCGVKEMIDRGVVLVPEDRRSEGVALTRGLLYNVELPGLRSMNLLGWMVPRREKEVTTRVVEQLGMAVGDIKARVGTLSGGTQQKVVFGKFLWMHPAVWLLADPTRGIDVSTKSEIYDLLRDKSREGVSFVFWSTDIDELMQTCDRVLVLYEFGVQAEFAGTQLVKESLLAAAFGAT